MNLQQDTIENLEQLFLMKNFKKTIEICIQQLLIEKEKTFYLNSIQDLKEIWNTLISIQHDCKVKNVFFLKKKH